MSKDYIQETNKFKRFWIRFWYNDITRLSLVLGIWWMIPLMIFLNKVIKINAETSRGIVTFLWFILILLAIHYNDYTNLRRIGRDEHGRKIK